MDSKGTYFNYYGRIVVSGVVIAIVLGIIHLIRWLSGL